MSDEHPNTGTIANERRQGSPLELAIVFGLTVGAPLALALSTGHLRSYEFGQSRLLTTVAEEGILVVLLWPLLASRGWALRSIAGAPVVGSVALGVAIHSYQGVLALTGILPIALVFTLYYVRTKRLWPVIVAHMLFDTLALLPVLKR